ncbi:MAG: cation diffusion facilitator family transporter [Acidocella sp.]|nr:cation diffusion facilitator family transporter [Acidocella sp.]
MKPIQKIAAGSIAVGCLVFAGKMLAAKVSGSTALFSDALEALVNVASSALALYALVIGAKPADEVHNYGHAKAELLSAVATGAMILLAAGLIFHRAILALWHPEGLAALEAGLGLGLALNAGAGGVNAVWGLVLRHVGRQERSPALLADAQHLFSDVLTSLGIVIALLVADWLRIPRLDPIIALGIAAQIAVMGWHTVMRSISGLLDEAPPHAITERIHRLVREHACGAIQAHDMRIRQAGPASFLEFHLVVPGEMTVKESHAICDRIEEALKVEMDGVIVTIHVEPTEKAKKEGALVP